MLFSSSELTLTFLFLDLGDLTERHRLAAVNNVSTVWCIRFLSALAQTCGPFLLCLHIMFLFIKQEKTFKKKKKILYTFKSLNVGTENPLSDTWHERFFVYIHKHLFFHFVLRLKGSYVYIPFKIMVTASCESTR